MPPSITETQTIQGDSDSIPIGPHSVRVENKVYDAEELARIHPGGKLFVKSFAGRDATTAFLSYHRKKFPHKKVSFALQRVDDTITEKDIAEVDEDFLELCSRVHRVIPRHKTFAPWYYYIKLFAIIAASFTLEFYIHYTCSYKWHLTAWLGLCFAMIGLNVQHDANHGAISSKWWVNRISGASMNYIGHSVVDWVHQHNVQHHIFTNHVHRDPDIDGTPLYRLNPLKPLFKIHALQYIYYFFIINLYGVTVSIYTFFNLLKGAHFTDFSVLVNSYWKWETMGPAFFIFRFYILPILRVPSLWTFVNILPAPAVFGQYVAFFFILSHNYVGVHHMNHETKSKSFVYNQVTCSSNVGGKILCFFNGGLNYQIEHHLFPRMSHCHYPTVAPIVKQFCEEKNIPYHHFPTITENFISTAEHLLGLGTEKTPRTLTFN